MKKIILLSLVVVLVVLGGVYLANVLRSTTIEDEFGVVSKEVKRDKIQVSFGQAVKVRGITITPIEVADSRCPSDVTCVQAGSVVAKFRIINTLGQETVEALELKEMMYDSKIVENGEKFLEILWTKVEPYPHTSRNINSSEYVFYFEVGEPALQ